MSSFTLTKQLRTGDERQIYRPEQLQSGSYIEVVEWHDPTSMTEKCIRAAEAIVGHSYSSQSTSKLRALRAAFNGDPHGALPLWRGIVTELEESAVKVVRLSTRSKLEVSQFQQIVALQLGGAPSNPEFQPELKTYVDLGLSPIGESTPGALLLDGEEVGRWMPMATLVLRSAIQES